MASNKESSFGDRSLQGQTMKEWKNKKTISTSSSANMSLSSGSSHNQDSRTVELSLLRTLSPILSEDDIMPSSTLQSTEMERKDSGWSESPLVPASRPSSRRTSTSASLSRRASPSKTQRRSHRTTHSTSSSRPSTGRASKSSPQTTQIHTHHPFTPSRPSFNSRHTSQSPTTPPQQVIPQFFHFPHFPSPEPPKPAPPRIQQPPPTVNYWTSDQTRRMEYAAIDAASQGIRGFVTKLIPACMLTKEFRRTRFCNGDEGSDAGSVRRYRLDLPEEDKDEPKGKKLPERMGIFRKWSGGLKKAGA